MKGRDRYRLVRKGLEEDRLPMFYPSMADADAFGSPLLAGL